jgi:glycosyltransferase involved in cell wall biosynthesis
VSARPLASAIVVNWNGADHLRIALPSLVQQSYAPLEILVVDNGSLDDSSLVVDTIGARWIALNHNRGCRPHAMRSTPSDRRMFDISEQ